MTTDVKERQAYVVVPYTKKHIPEMVECVRKFLYQPFSDGSVNRFSEIDFCPEKVYSILESEIADPNNFTKVVISKGKVVGGIRARCSEYIFSKEKIVVDSLIYIDPSYKNPAAIHTLLKEYVRWAKKKGAREVMMSTSTGFKTNGFELLAKRHGFEPEAFGYLRRI